MKIPRRGSIATLLVLLATTFVACDDNNGTPQGPTDTTPPSITNVVPADEASGIAPDTPILAVFDEPLDPETIDASTFFVTSEDGTLAGTVSYSDPAARFTPSSALADGVTYTATITTGVKDEAGNALEADRTWHFTTAIVVQKAWGTPVLLETDANPAGVPAVAADPDDNGSGDGTATVAWVQHDGTQESIYASRYDGSWSAPVTIEDESTGGYAGGAYSPRVAMNRYGQAAVAWGYSDGSNNYRVWSNRYDNGAWQNAENISAFSGNANSPQVFFDASGDNLFSVWSQYQLGSSQYNYRALHRQYYYARCPDLTVDTGCVANPGQLGWRSISMIDSHDVGDAGEPQVAAWGTRNAVAVWTQNTTAGNQIWANIATNGEWSTPVRVNVGLTSGAAAPVVAVDGSGNAFVVWMEWEPGRTALYASRYGADSETWTPPVHIDDPTGGNAGDYDPPRHQVAMDANGKALVVWQQANADRSEYSIYARRFPDGSPEAGSTPEEIEHGTGYADFPALAIAPNGDAIAVWKQEDGGARRIYANHYAAATGTWHANPSLVGGADSTWNEGPQIAIDGFGNATVVWTEVEAGAYNVYANRFE